MWLGGGGYATRQKGLSTAVLDSRLRLTDGADAALYSLGDSGHSLLLWTALRSVAVHGRWNCYGTRAGTGGWYSCSVMTLIVETGPMCVRAQLLSAVTRCTSSTINPMCMCPYATGRHGRQQERCATGSVAMCYRESRACLSLVGLVTCPSTLRMEALRLTTTSAKFLPN
jgi:hypothetical protein